MNDDEPDRDDPAARLAELTKAKDNAAVRGLDRTASRLAMEIKRAAKNARQLDYYIWSLYTLMVSSGSLIDHEVGREAAVELIALLESEDRARQIQPDFDQTHYDSFVSRLSSCAYDNLATTTAACRGYNSEGLHDAIAEGIQVCRRTGKLECVACFREYASEVFRASDDLPMALHHARHVAGLGPNAPGAVRRWSGAYTEALLLLIAGSIGAAETAARRAWELCDTYHDPLNARLSTANVLRTALLLKGEDDSLSDLAGFAAVAGSAPSADESPLLQLRGDLVNSLRSLLRGDRAVAIDTLTAWDRRLQERRSLDLWFEVRLRLIAANRISGDENRATALARQLKAKATEARDWLTLRRLTRALDQNVPVSPIASVGPTILGPTQSFGAAVVDSVTEAAERADHSTGQDPDIPTPLAAKLQAIEDQLGRDADDPAAKQMLLDSLLEVGPDVATDPRDVARMLNLALRLYVGPACGPPIWNWAERIAAPFPRDAFVLSRFAYLGAMLRNAENSQVADRIDVKRIEQVVRQSLDLDPNDAGIFERAAIHYLNAGRTNEAERCLARCLRLDRGNARAALWLADIYGQSDRLNDALAVVDIALRAGADGPDIAWRAVLNAYSLSQFEAMLTYLDHFERVRPGRPVVNYYRAAALLSLGRPAQALAALDEEDQRNKGTRLNVIMLRACALSALGLPDDFRANVAAALEIRWSEVDYVTYAGLVKLTERLWDAVNVLPADDSVVASLADRLLVTGLAPNKFFTCDRTSKPKAESLKYYICTVLQPLDDRWQRFAGCLNDEGSWQAYRCVWGVLAADEDEARSMVLQWQARCYPLEPSVEEVSLQSEGHVDHPGVVWQGLRSAVE